MFGAMLLSAPTDCRNRNLFPELLLRNASYLSMTNMSLLLMSTIAIDDGGGRIKTGSTCAPLGDVRMNAVNPYPDSNGFGITPPDLYLVPITDSPVLDKAPAPDVMAYGGLTMHSCPEQGLGLYTCLTGTAFAFGAECNRVPADALDLLIKDADPDANFVTKVRRDIMTHLSGRYSAQVISAGPDPFLVLMQNERPIHLNFVAYAGCFYLVWADFHIEYGDGSDARNRPYVWPMMTFEHSERLLLGFSMRMLRNRWIRWLTPKQAPRHVDEVDLMKIPKAIAALQQWLAKRTA